MKKLIIVESPNKIKSIEHYLGSDWKVMASVGHIFELPASGIEKLGIDTVEWEPLYRPAKDKKGIIAELAKTAAEMDIVYIATDPDREGEAIADHLVTELHISNKYQRVRFNEITEEAIKQAIAKADAHPKEATIDAALVNSQKTRRMLDRIIGFRLSQLMRKKVKNTPQTPSAGRVQSIALKLTVDRECEIEKFVPIKYFKIQADLGKEIIANYNNPNGGENKDWVMPEKIDVVYNSLEGDLEVKSVNESKRRERKYVPLKQAHLYKIADSSAGLSSISTKRATQRLFEGYGKGGLISYPRTDSTRYSKSFMVKAEDYITKKYGKEYFDENVKGEVGDQDAHEAIRPTDISLTPNMAKEKFNIGETELKVYSLIYYHTLKCLMTQPEKLQILYKLENHGHEFHVSTFKILFPGYYAIGESPIAKELPMYKEGEKIPVIKYIKEENATKPPARYTEGSLIDKLDEIKVGRPSTFSTTIETIISRLFVIKEGKSLIPTQFGRLILGKLLEAFPDIINEKYTAQIEEELDKIAENKHDYKRTMNEFYSHFNQKLTTAYSTMELEKIPVEKLGEQCEKCGKDLVYRMSKKSKTRFTACSGFPECRFTKSLPDAKPWRVFKKKKN